MDFPFLFWRNVRAFSLAPLVLLSMPVRIFWSMSRNVERLQAQEDLRALNVQLCAACTAQGDKDFLAELRQSLLEQMGSISVAQAPASPKSDILALMQQSNT